MSNGERQSGRVWAIARRVEQSLGDLERIARLELAGHFPKRVQLGQCRVAWIADKVQAWVDECVAKRDMTTPS
jgi:hypothetical protein